MPNAVRTTESNFTFLGPAPNIADLPSQIDRENGLVASVWRPTPEELELLQAGGQIKLTISQLPMPPVALEVVQEEEIVGDGETRCENCGAIWDNERGMLVCGHCGTSLGPEFQRVEDEKL